MNRYAEMKRRQQEEFNSFPRQFAEGMEKLGLEPSDTDKVFKSPGGGIYRREDSQRLKAMFERFDQELKEAVAADKTGEDFIYEMFLCEMENHEYGYTGDLDETLDVLGYTLDEILADGRLSRGLAKTHMEIMGE